MTRHGWMEYQGLQWYHLKLSSFFLVFAWNIGQDSRILVMDWMKLGKEWMEMKRSRKEEIWNWKRRASTAWHDNGTAHTHTHFWSTFLLKKQDTFCGLKSVRRHLACLFTLQTIGSKGDLNAEGTRARDGTEWSGMEGEGLPFFFHMETTLY